MNVLAAIYAYHFVSTITAFFCTKYLFLGGNFE
jgi:hypothetical protein